MLKLSYIFFLISCFSCNEVAKNRDANNTVDTLQKIKSGTHINDTTDFYVTIKRLYPFFSLQVDTSLTYYNYYKKCEIIDTTNCSSFSLHRIFIGTLTNVVAEVKLKDVEYKRYYLQSKNLKLWVCSLPQGVKTNDKILITANVYNVMGFERTFGYPSILLRICKK